jgi:hypothetical protein
MRRQGFTIIEPNFSIIVRKEIKGFTMIAKEII